MTLKIINMKLGPYYIKNNIFCNDRGINPTELIFDQRKGYQQIRFTSDLLFRKDYPDTDEAQETDYNTRTKKERQAEKLNALRQQFTQPIDPFKIGTQVTLKCCDICDDKRGTIIDVRSDEFPQGKYRIELSNGLHCFTSIDNLELDLVYLFRSTNHIMPMFGGTGTGKTFTTAKMVEEMNKIEKDPRFPIPPGTKVRYVNSDTARALRFNYKEGVIAERPSQSPKLCRVNIDGRYIVCHPRHLEIIQQPQSNNMKQNFTVGCKVKRTNYEHAGMKPGDIGTVTHANSSGVRIEEFDTLGEHNTRNLEVILETPSALKVGDRVRVKHGAKQFQERKWGMPGTLIIEVGGGYDFKIKFDTPFPDDMLDEDDGELGDADQFELLTEEVQFKIGDRVEIIGHDPKWNTFPHLGEIGTIREITDDKSITVALKGSYTYRDPSQLKLITSKSTEMKSTFNVTRDQFTELYEAACRGWKPTVMDKAKAVFTNPLLNSGIIDREWLDKAWAASDDKQKDVIRKVFPDYEIKDTNPMKKITGNGTVLRDFNYLLFNRLRIVANTYDVKPELKNRSLYVDNKLEVILHKEPIDGGTIIEFREKKS